MPITCYIWDIENDNYLMETDETDAVTATFTIEPFACGILISQRRGATTSTFHLDSLDSTISLTDSSESVTDTYSYGAFGDLVNGAGSTINPFRYIGGHGYYFDAELDTYYVRARDYRVGIARWTSQDPLSRFISIQAYAYANNNPINMSDITGLIAVKPDGNKLGRLRCPDHAYMRWDFVLDNKAPCDGFIVQKVDVFCQSEPCKGRRRGSQIYHYWEAWFVKKNSTISHVHRGFEMGTPFIDTAGFKYKNFRFGFYLQHGSIRFYCMEKNDDPRAPAKRVGTSDLRREWKQGTAGTGKCKTSAGGLPRTLSEPFFWKEDPIEGTPRRWFGVEWDCCPCPQGGIANAQPLRAS